MSDTKAQMLNKWLGIRPEEMPCSHYRLLGLQDFEDDPDVIDSAADRQTLFMRQKASGQHQAFASELLNSLAKARTILLHPEQKAEYDAKLRNELAAKSAPPVPPQGSGVMPPLTPSQSSSGAMPAVPHSSSSVMPVVAASQSGSGVMPGQLKSSQSASTRRTPAKKKNQQPLILGGAGLLLLLICIGTYFAVSGNGDDEEGDDPAAVVTQPAVTPPVTPPPRVVQPPKEDEPKKAKRDREKKKDRDKVEEPVTPPAGTPTESIDPAEKIEKLLYLAHKARKKDEEEKAASYLLQAANMGSADAQLQLAARYALGKGVPVDLAESLRWCKTAADQDNSDAQYYVGMAYLTGKGVTANVATAREWFTKSAANGNSKAEKALKKLPEAAVVTTTTPGTTAGATTVVNTGPPLDHSRVLLSTLTTDESLQARVEGGAYDLKTNLYISTNRNLTTLEPLGELENLQTLMLRKCYVLEDISALEKLKNLRRLDMYYLPKVPASQVTRLQAALPDCEISSVRVGEEAPMEAPLVVSTIKSAPIAALPQDTDDAGLLAFQAGGLLEQSTSLNLQNCKQITSVAPLAKLPNLTSLDLSGCSGVTSVAPLGTAKSLTTLNLDGCSKILPQGVEALRKQLPQCKINATKGLCNPLQKTVLLKRATRDAPITKAAAQLFYRQDAASAPVPVPGAQGVTDSEGVCTFMLPATAKSLTGQFAVQFASRFGAPLPDFQNTSHWTFRYHLGDKTHSLVQPGVIDPNTVEEKPSVAVMTDKHPKYPKIPKESDFSSTTEWKMKLAEWKNNSSGLGYVQSGVAKFSKEDYNPVRKELTFALGWDGGIDTAMALASIKVTPEEVTSFGTATQEGVLLAKPRLEGEQVVLSEPILNVGGKIYPVQGKPLPDTITLMPGKLGMQLKLIRPGAFVRQTSTASSRRYPVQITKPYYIGIFEVKQQEWFRVTGKRLPPSSLKKYAVEPNCPMVEISYNDIVKSFLPRLNETLTVPLPGKWKAALPTEAQWEYAARAGTTTEYFFGEDDTDIADYAWYSDNTRGASDFAHYVGQKKPNPWGLYDVYGNVSELCSDYYDYSSYAAAPLKDPTGPRSGTRHIMRGGGQDSSETSCSSVYRYYAYPTTHSENVGFRIVLTLDD